MELIGFVLIFRKINLFQNINLNSIKQSVKNKQDPKKIKTAGKKNMLLCNIKKNEFKQ